MLVRIAILQYVRKATFLRYASAPARIKYAHTYVWQYGDKGAHMKIGVVNTKGGVGKTTIAVHLAAMLAGQAPTLLIDGDPQGSAVSWAAWRREAEREPTP